MVYSEKYRPVKLKNVVSQDNITQILNNMLKKKIISHMLFHGPCGIGKTTTAMCFYREAKNLGIVSLLLELNASDEKGIDIVRTKIKNFALRLSNNKIKLIILDEADALTRSSQMALRRMMEEYSKTTKFIFICNYYEKIHEPIVSRCILFKFNKLRKNDVKKIIKGIFTKESISYESEKVIEMITDLTDGDMRKSINIINILSLITNKNITKKSIKNYTIYNKNLKKIFNSIVSKKTDIIKDIKYIINNNINIYLFMDTFEKLLMKSNIVNISEIMNYLFKLKYHVSKNCNVTVELLIFIHNVKKNIILP